jgi:hypothetical protein
MIAGKSDLAVSFFEASTGAARQGKKAPRVFLASLNPRGMVGIFSLETVRFNPLGENQSPKNWNRIRRAHTEEEPRPTRCKRK